MKNEVFTLMNVSRQKFINEIKLGRNPNPLRNRGEGEYEKQEVSVATVVIPLLQAERVYEQHHEQKDTVMENLGAIRRVSFMERVREVFVQKIYELFEVALIEA